MEATSILHWQLRSHQEVGFPRDRTSHVTSRDNPERDVSLSLCPGTKKFPCPAALCVQMDFMRTFEANTKCNNIKYVWSHFYQILVVLKHHRRLWNNIFDTDIFRCIKTHIKGVYLAFFGIFMLLEMFVSKILCHRRLWYFRTTKIW